MQNTWPNFFIVGAQKSGTTSVYEYLKQHPQVYMSPIKEPHFFSRDRVRVDRDLMVTRELDYLHLFRCTNGFRVVGEASQSYLWHPEAPQRIAATSPDARIIVLLRDPIERAYSHYLMDIMDGCAPKPFYNVLVAEFEFGEKVYGTGHLYVELGQYAEQVKRYTDVFGFDRVQVLMFEDFRSRPIELMTQILGFLEVDSASLQSIAVNAIQNPFVAPGNALIQYLMRFRQGRLMWRRMVPAHIRRLVRNNFLAKKIPKPPMDPRAVAFLQSIYEPDVTALETLLGRHLPELRVTWP